MGDDEEDRGVKGTKEALAMAAKGMELFAKDKEEEFELDTDAATKFKEEADAKVKALEAEADALTGKDNKKARQEKSKEAAAVKTSPEYIDAQRVLKGQPPKNGNFAKLKSAAVKASTEVKAEAKDDDKKKDKDDKKPKKAQESAGISKAERDELEKLKNDIIARKKELKEGGMSGGQINKDEQVAGWVARMNELKEKENPGALAAAKEEKKGKKKVLSAEQEAAKKDLEAEIEVYRAKLKSEFGYSNKDIKADPDLNDMLKRLNEMK